MKTFVWFAIPVVFATTWLGFNTNAVASIDPMAHEVVMQTWWDIPQPQRMRYCDTKNAKAIVKRYNNNATPRGKRELVKAYKYYILNNC